MRTPDSGKTWGYKAIYDDLAEQIDGGEHLKPGDRLPSRRDLAAMYRVNESTIFRALGSLEATGRIRGRQGAYVTVVGPATVLPPAAGAGEYGDGPAES